MTELFGFPVVEADLPTPKITLGDWSRYIVPLIRVRSGETMDIVLFTCTSGDYSVLYVNGIHVASAHTIFSYPPSRLFADIQELTGIIIGFRTIEISDEAMESFSQPKTLLAALSELGFGVA